MAIESVSGKTINNVLPAKSNAKEAVDVKQKSAVSVSNDTVDFTATAQGIKTSAVAGGNVPVINEERVAAISIALQSGSYKVDAGRVAEKMLNFEDKLPDST